MKLQPGHAVPLSPLPLVALRVHDAAGGACALVEGARAGLRGDLPLLSASGAALWLGADLFLAQMRHAETLAPDAAGLLAPWPVLDCRNAPGLALDALRKGVAAVVLEATDPAFATVAAIAESGGRRVLEPAQLRAAGPFAAGDPALTAWLVRLRDTAGRLG
ncbi:hypothetical protein ACFOD4_14290 [Pseudoroseomonas globiformis]|uniref:Uncharacterized protein n=1 Tax=Teichococcus globiformis TaxID=2307229 RepID=A0ABV7G3W5_9PROT